MGPVRGGLWPFHAEKSTPPSGERALRLRPLRQSSASPSVAKGALGPAALHPQPWLVGGGGLPASPPFGPPSGDPESGPASGPPSGPASSGPESGFGPASTGGGLTRMTKAALAPIPP